MTNEDEYVWRSMIKDKEDLYENMNMTHLYELVPKILRNLVSSGGGKKWCAVP
jgi:hypothetical protein